MVIMIGGVVMFLVIVVAGVIGVIDLFVVSRNVCKCVFVNGIECEHVGQYCTCTRQMYT